jgi:hypothetical protein
LSTSDQVTIAGLILGVFGIVLTIIYGRRSLKPPRRRLEWTFEAIPLFSLGRATWRSTLEVKVLGRMVADPYLATLTLFNLGRVDIRPCGVTTGIEVGKMAHGTGPIPFIRTSDLSNWELKADPKHGVGEELYKALKDQHPDRFDVQAGDILLVKDGTYLVGTSAVLSDLDTDPLSVPSVQDSREGASRTRSMATLCCAELTNREEADSVEVFHARHHRHTW